MTEAYEDGKYLVRVRAQVMTRDDSTGGWVPMGGGGLSNVSVRKRHLAACVDYLIFGKRISDQSVVLSCTIKKDFEYNKVMPTFHHWKTGDKKFGLTFQTAADARAFDKGVRTAVEELLDGLCETALLHKSHADVGDDEVFMTLNLPVERGDSRSSSDSSSRGGNGGGGLVGGRTSPAPEPRHLHRMTFGPRRDKLASDSPPAAAPAPAPAATDADNYSYVQLTAVHEYIYPGGGGADDKSDPTAAMKKPAPPPLAPPPKKAAAARRCRHCQELFSEERNVRGACEFAPDCARAAINRVSCVGCAEAMLYHCLSDAEGEFARHPCACGGAGEEGWGRRWGALALLSLLLPCLCCYPPLRACHLAAVACGCCGGRHAAS